MAVADDEPDLILLTEFIPKAQVNPIQPALLAISGYNLYLNFDPGTNNLGSCGLRGIGIFTKQSINATEIHFPKFSLIEQLWLQIPLRGSDFLLVGCIYRSPSTHGPSSTANLLELLKACTANKNARIMIAGDVNFPQIDWTHCYSLAPDGHYTHDFIEGIHECSLTQHVTKDTRHRIGVKPSGLDVLLSNEEGLVRNLSYLPPIGSSDHVVLRFDTICCEQLEDPKMPRLNYHKGNYALLNDLIGKTIWEEPEPPDPRSRYESFKRKLTLLTSSCIPKSCPITKRRNIYMDKEAMRLKKKKRKLWAVYSQAQDNVSLARYKRCNNDLRRLTRRLRQELEMKLVSDLKSNPKGFWRYVSSRTKTKTCVDKLRTETGNLTESDAEKAEILNAFFSSVCKEDDLCPIPQPTALYAGPVVEDVSITEDLVRQKLSQIKTSSAAGPDNIHPRVLHETRNTVSTQLAAIYRESLDTGILPEDWTIANVIPIYKKGSKDEPDNYRPVSLTSVPCKVLEAIIRDRIMEHLQDEALLTEAQYGFRPGRSCATQLAIATEDWTKAAERGDPTDILYLDLAKAFNTVSTRRLLHKIAAHGIRGKLLRWIEAFLVGRKQRVVVGESFSNWTPVESGVPQGSVLAPTLFILYMNDLPSALNCNIMIFADDSKLYQTVRHPEEALSLQANLDAAVRWADMWQLTFNAAKCKALHIGRHAPRQDYYLNGTLMQMVTDEKDLGVIVDSELKFRKQAAAAVNKASRVVAVIRRSFSLLDIATLPLLFKTLVRPHLEYGNIVWGPFNRSDQLLVERVQRRATKLVQEIRHLPYQDRLRFLKLPSLHYRRRRGDMIAVYQVLHGKLDLNPETFFSRPTARETRGHQWRLAKPQAATRVRRNTFSVRVVNDWNRLPPSVVGADSVNQFKSRLDTHWAHLQYTPPMPHDQ